MGVIGITEKEMETTMVYYIRVMWDYMGLLEVHGTYNLLSNCSFNPGISSITIVMEPICRLFPCTCLCGHLYPRKSLRLSLSFHESLPQALSDTDINVAPDLMEGFGLMKSFRGIIQNQLLFEGFGIMKSFWDRKYKK